MSWLLNMAAFRSLTEDFDACQFGSRVLWAGLFSVKADVGEVAGFGEAKGDVGALAGCVICTDSLWETLFGGDTDKPPPLIVSTEILKFVTPLMILSNQLCS